MIGVRLNKSIFTPKLSKICINIIMISNFYWKREAKDSQGIFELVSRNITDTVIVKAEKNYQKTNSCLYVTIYKTYD